LNGTDDATPSIIDASQERDEIYGTDTMGGGAGGGGKKGAKQMVQEQMNAYYKSHNATYNTYLQQSHQERELLKIAKQRKQLVAKGGIDIGDPTGVNMGMDRGLDEPRLHAPKATEPLWTQSASVGGNGGSETRGRLPVDENRLIQKKYNAVPVTQAELRDCANELPPEELKLVTASHKVM